MRRAICILLLAALAACAPLMAPPGPDAASPVLSKESFAAADRAVLPVRAWSPKGDVKAVIVALHGFNDYSNFFATPGEFLAADGIAAYAYDQRGFGGSPNRGVWPGFRAYVEDLKAFVKEVRASHPGTPLYLLGESMGGAVAMAALTGSHPPDIAGVILAAPAVWGRETMPFYQTWALWIAAHTLPWLEVTGRGFKIMASDNIEMLRALGRDKKVIKSTRIDTIYGLVNLMDAALQSSSRLNVPALILYGEKDAIIPRKSTYQMLKSLPAQAREKIMVAFYENGYHMLLRDLQAKTVWRDIAAWIDNPAAALPSGADGRARVVLNGK